MSTSSSGPIGPQHAITDVIDLESRRFLVRYPAALVVGLSLAGVGAFALTGFLGYRDSAEPSLTFTLFKEPWPLFLWFCALIMTLEVSILRNRVLRGKMVAALGVTLLSMLIVGAAYFYGKEIQHLLDNLFQNLLHIRSAIPEIGKSKFTYAIINFGLLAIFWSDTIRRWIRGARGEPINPTVDLGLDDGTSRKKKKEEEQPTLEELISGDLIAGAFLTLLLALIFRADIINFFSDALQIHVSITTCTVSWPFGTCLGGANLTDPPTLSFIDLLQALIYLPLGLLILAISATLSGLAAGGGVSERPAHSPALVDDARRGAAPIAQDVAATVLNTLRAAINRRAKLAAGNFALSWRNVIWPGLVLVSVIAVATAAREIQNYLHLLSDKQTCTVPGFLPCSYVDNTLLTNGQPYTSIALALIYGVIAVLAITLSMALLVFSRRVAENTMRFLALIGLIVLLTFWIFSLALSLFNGLFWLVANHAVRVPFPQPGASTIGSFLCFVIFGAYIVFRRMRGPRVPSRAVGGGMAGGAQRISDR
ncbi:MAG: hypothetical protein IVW57_06170 [Ktedonobacterales bacterium]|nr:hypothetical protein [Ktedonobacterales bacterium]